ncbi:MAG: YbaB/EbfC family nucleoid-associated protein [Planctomycetales bacterium]|nr:YbaB/EbfC family nucleoid-associated protein [Planctomycetales bacterium]MCA9180910.1 YbaB/EbfC family nucleoid-associated protein [Planctomycetales bacterium]
MFKNLSGLAQLMRNASSMGERAKELRESLAAQTATGFAGGDLVTVEVSGIGEVKKLRIAPELMQRNDVELIEELVPAALNEALTKVRAMSIEKMRELTGGIDLPGLDDAFANFS